MGLGSFLDAIGQGLQGNRYNPLGNGNQSQGGGRYNPLGDNSQQAGGAPQEGGGSYNPLTAGWTQPTGSGLSMGQAPQLPMHNSGLLQSIMADQQPQQPSGGGLHEILMRLGLFH